MRYFRLSFAALTILALVGCQRDGLLDDLDPYQGDWLLPLVRSEVSLQELSKLQQLRLTTELTADSLGLPPGSVGPIPPIALPLVGPLPLEVASFLEEIRADIAELQLELDNGLPIAISAGTTIELRNTADPNDPGNLLYSVSLPSDLEPNSSYSTTITNTEVIVYDTLHVFLRNVASPGTANASLDGAVLGITLIIDMRSVDLVRIRTNEHFTMRDTFALTLADDLEGQTDVASGFLVVYADNGLPVKGEMQLYTYDAGGNLLDSLFDQPFVLNGGQTNPAGQTIFTASVSDSVAVNEQRLETWRNGRSAVLVIRADTDGYPGPWVQADALAALRLQLVGDLRLNLAYSRFE